MSVKKIYAALLALAVVATAPACNDDSSDYAPGEKVDVKNQVYLPDLTTEACEVNPGESYAATFTFYRENAADAMSCPLQISDTEHFTAPESLSFAAGQATADVAVEFKGTEQCGTYTCSVSIPAGDYNSPYTAQVTSADLRVTVISWELISDQVTVISQDMYNGYAEDPQLPRYTTSLYKAEGSEKYYLEGFSRDYDLRFETVLPPASDGMSEGLYYIRPLGGCYSTDYYGSAAWYFGETDEDSFKIYWPGSSIYLDDAYFYVNASSYGYTYFNPTKQKGGFYMFAYKYDMDDTSLGYTYCLIEFSWK